MGTNYLFTLQVLAILRGGIHMATKTAVAAENKEKIHITAAVFRNSSKGK